MKKLLATMMTIVLCVCVLAGCGGSSGSGGSSGGDAAPADSGEAVDVTVTVWGPQEGTQESVRRQPSHHPDGPSLHRNTGI